MPTEPDLIRPCTQSAHIDERAAAEAATMAAGGNGGGNGGARRNRRLEKAGIWKTADRAEARERYSAEPSARYSTSIRLM